MESIMALALLFGQMEAFTKENGRTAGKMGRVSLLE